MEQNLLAEWCEQTGGAGREIRLEGFADLTATRRVMRVQVLELSPDAADPVRIEDPVAVVFYGEDESILTTSFKPYAGVVRDTFGLNVALTSPSA